MKENEEIIQELIKIRHERDWEQFHNSKDLALAINIEAGELLVGRIENTIVLPMIRCKRLLIF